MLNIELEDFLKTKFDILGNALICFRELNEKMLSPTTENMGKQVTRCCLKVTKVAYQLLLSTQMKTLHLVCLISTKNEEQICILNQTISWSGPVAPEASGDSRKILV